MENVETPGGQEKTQGLRVSRTSMVLLSAFVVFMTMLWISTARWTAPQAIVWHATHGNTVSVGGHTIPIPWDMLVSESDSDGVTISRDAPEDNNFNSPFGTLMIETAGREIDFTKDLERLSKLNQSPHADYRYIGAREFDGTQTKGMCWELMGSVASGISISCRFDKSTIGVDFVGSASYREKIYHIAAVITGAA
jgi:hypothetical protein